MEDVCGLFRVRAWFIHFFRCDIEIHSHQLLQPKWRARALVTCPPSVLGHNTEDILPPVLFFEFLPFSHTQLVTIVWILHLHLSPTWISDSPFILLKLKLKQSSNHEAQLAITHHLLFSCHSRSLRWCSPQFRPGCPRTRHTAQWQTCQCKRANILDWKTHHLILSRWCAPAGDLSARESNRCDNRCKRVCTLLQKLCLWIRGHGISSLPPLPFPLTRHVKSGENSKQAHTIHVPSSVQEISSKLTPIPFVQK